MCSVENDSLAAGYDIKFTALLDVISQVSFWQYDLFSALIPHLHTRAVGSILQKLRFMKGIINVGI